MPDGKSSCQALVSWWNVAYVFPVQFTVPFELMNPAVRDPHTAEHPVRSTSQETHMQSEHTSGSRRNLQYGRFKVWTNRYLFCCICPLSSQAPSLWNARFKAGGQVAQCKGRGLSDALKGRGCLSYTHWMLHVWHCVLCYYRLNMLTRATLTNSLSFFLFCMCCCCASPFSSPGKSIIFSPCVYFQFYFAAGIGCFSTVMCSCQAWCMLGENLHQCLC